jgi:uncharacterized protein (DUF1697 family)
MKQLVAIFEAAGAADVRTYIQSGNVVFTGSASLARRIPAAVAAAISKRFHFDVPVVTRTAAEIRKVARSNPFSAAAADPTKVAVVFLKDRPTAPAAGALDPERSPPDRFALIGRELYLHMPGGAAKTKLTNAYLDRTLKTTSTARNWKTVLKLVEMTGGVAASGR